jgi:ribonuclease HI
MMGLQEVEAHQVNLNKCYMAQVELGNKIKKLKEFIMLIQEPYCYKGRTCLIPKGIDKVSFDDHPRALILASKALAISQVTHLCSRDWAVGLLRLGGKQTLLVSAYLDITLSPVPQEFIQIIKYAEQRRFALLIGVDSNAHSKLWMSRDNNSRGRALTDYIIENNLKVENIGCVPTFECSTGKSIIDLTLTRGLKLKIEDWKVCRSDNHSDHNTIKFQLCDEIIELPSVRPWDRMDWSKFKVAISGTEIKLPEFINYGVVDNLTNQVYTGIEAALDKVCPLTQPTTVVLSNPWFTKGLYAKRKEVFALWDKFVANKSQVNWDRYKAKLKNYKKHCDKVKRKYRNTYKEKLGDIKSMANFVDSISKPTTPHIGTVQRPDGSYTLPGTETLRALADIHFPTHGPTPRQNSVRTLDYRTVVDSNQDWINPERITKAFNDFKSKKSPGTDGLKPIVLKHLPQTMIMIIELIYKAMILLHYTPEEWTKARVVFIPKPGKPDYTSPKAFRPISLTNYLLKGMEKLTRWKMDEMLKFHPIDSHQHGFRKGYSTESAISNTVHAIERRLLNQQYCLGVFLDIQSAFDSIQPRHIREKLLEHGCPVDAAEWYFEYLKYRVIIIEGKNSKFTTNISVGFPQGGVCSASFWAIAYNEAVKILNARGLEGQVYADDSCALIGGTDLNFMFRRMNQVLEQLSAWGQKCGLKFNAAKTEAILFSRDNPNKRKFSVPVLKMEGKRIPLAETVKYLGVTLDRRLHWTDHINDKINKCKQLMMKIFAEVRGNFGPKPKLIKWAYEGIVRPKLTYACLVWGHEVRTQAAQAKIKALDRLAIRSMATISRKCPQASLEVIVDLIPLDLLIKQLGCAAYLRLYKVITPPVVNYTVKTKSHSKPHLQHWIDQIDKWGLNTQDTDHCDETIWEKSFHINLDSFDGHKKHRKHSEYTAYTDGSKTVDGTGAGFVIYHKNEVLSYESIKLNDNASVFQAEITAIRYAANYLYTLKNVKFVKILVDSQAALLALNKQQVTADSVLKAIYSLEKLSQKGIVVRLAWVKAHAGIQGNEMADSAAKLGGQDDMGTNIKAYLKKPKAELKMNLERAVRETWTQRWKSDSRYWMTKQFLTKPDKSAGRRACQLSKSSLSRLIQLITGHNFLSYFQFKLDSTINPLCRMCEESNETFFHLLTDCPALEVKRREWFLDKPPITDCWKPGELLRFSMEEPINSWLTDRDYLMEQPLLEIDINYSITDSDSD